ncbi:MAG: hypothetical protein R3233_10775, partial [Xanthomonadales bacterium]|nr:hypothetical protein [Xanthomonadales bacterium]
NGIAEAGEQVCSSTTPDDLELCDIFEPQAGEWWIVVQNWDNGQAQDSVTAISFVTAPGSNQPLAVSGDGIIPEGAVSEVRVSWQDVDAKTGETLYGAVGLGTDRNNPNNVGVVPVRYSRTGIETAETLPLKPGREHGFALAGNASWDKAFIDVPAGVQSVSFEVQGASGSENQALNLDLYLVPFNQALDPANVPFVQAPAGAPTQSASGTTGAGPQLTVNSPAEGRWFAVVRNSSGNAASVRLTATLNHDSKIAVHRGLWDFMRGGQGAIAQGVEWQAAGGSNFILWYTYDELGQPAWYIAAAPQSSGNVWTADLLRVTNNGTDQQEMPVGQVVLTFISPTQAVFSYTLFGFSGTDPMAPNATPNTCPNIGGVKNWTGHWYRGVAGLGGATLLAYAAAQAQVHYFYDDDGVPRWLIAAESGSGPNDPDLPLLQFKGFCAVCPSAPITLQQVGTVERSFGSDSTGSWTLDFSLAPPLQQDITRTDSITKLSDALVCQ